MTIGQDTKSQDGPSSPQTSPKPPSLKVRDPKWLQIQVCHEFSLGKCTRGDTECSSAHPPSNCLVEHGKVTACFDAMKGRCQRENCKYFHPPKQIKSRLEALGRSFQQYRGPAFQKQHSAPCTTASTNTENSVFVRSVSQRHWPSNWCSTENVPVEPVSPISPTLPRRLDKSDKLEICSDFMAKSCKYEEKLCPFAHPPPNIPPDNEGYVTVCMDFMKGDCQRTACRYFHPPPHLQARVRAVQRRPSHLSGPLSNGPNSSMHHQPLILVSPMPFPGQQIPMPTPNGLPPPPLISVSQEMLIPVNRYMDASCMMPLPIPAMQHCFWPGGETMMMPVPREGFQPVLGHCYDMMTPPSTP
eukprot:gene11030-12194_t